jgi:hypothetical protein
MSGRATELYRGNPFRILALPVTADAADIRRRGRELQVRASPEGAESEAAEAAARLDDAVLRLEAELYWRWLPDEEEAALDRLAAGGSEVAGHDLAVLRHSAVLESPVDEWRRWRPALEAWEGTWRDDRFWARLRERAEALGDARATVATVDRLRGELPGRVLSASATAIAGLLEDDRGGAASEALIAVAASSFPATDVQRARAAALDGLVRRVRDLLTEHGPSPALIEAARALGRVEPLSPVAERVLDEAADDLRERALALAHERRDLLLARPLLEAAVALATSTMVRARAEALLAEWDLALARARAEAIDAVTRRVRRHGLGGSRWQLIGTAAAMLVALVAGIATCRANQAPPAPPPPTFAPPTFQPQLQYPPATLPPLAFPPPTLPPDLIVTITPPP